MRPSLAALAALALLAAGCAAPPAPGPGPGSAPPASADVPVGCDAARPAVAHGPNASASPRMPAALPVPCAFYPGGTGGEPTLGVCPQDGAVYYYPAALSVPIAAGGGIGGGYVARSLDNGATWDHVAPMAGPFSQHANTLDPYFYLDPATCRIFAEDLQTADCAQLSFSDDRGATWVSVVEGCTEFDHQTIFAGKPVSSPTLNYPTIVYRCAINTVALAGLSTSSTCLKSLDGGLTFVNTGAPAFVTPTEGLPDYCDGALGHGIVDPQGRVLLPKGWCGQPWLAISEDEGQTWTRTQIAANGMNREADGYPGHEAGVAVDSAGNVFYFWVAEDRLPYLALSRDGGATWGAPLMVGLPGLREASLPELTAGGEGKVAFVYMGSTNSPGPPFPPAVCDPPPLGCTVNDAPPTEAYENVTWNAYVGMSLDALADAPTFLTAAVNDPADPLVRGPCGAVRCQEVFDFLDVRLGPDGTPWAALVDACMGDCASGAERSDNAGEALVGHLVGGPSLLDPPSTAGPETASSSAANQGRRS
ncbi:MAG TPA: sialidase family protein [Candidatus Thermoplasmatota archaeon]|jgi:hypothetical protein|nr:sialidase family protein [Candidatus Thermoplasmatota archaeon]